MANTQTSLELRGLLLAVIAGLAVVGAAFGVSALVRKAMPQAAQPTPAAQSLPTVVGGMSENFTAQMITTGSQLYGKSCASCHGPTGSGAVGPNLHHLRLPDARITAIIKNGKGAMPGFGDQYKAGQINDIVGFVRTLK